MNAPDPAIDRTDYGHGVNVQHRGDEFRVCVGNFAVKNFTNAEEADDYAKKLAQKKAAADR